MAFALSENNVYITPVWTAYSNIWKQTAKSEQTVVQANMVDIISQIDSRQTYSFTGTELKKIIVRSYMGDFDGFGLEFSSVAQNIYKSKGIQAEVPMDKNDINKIYRKAKTKSLRDTIMKQSHKFEEAKKKKGQPINLPEVDEETAKYLFNDDNGDDDC